MALLLVVYESVQTFIASIMIFNTCTLTETSSATYTKQKFWRPAVLYQKLILLLVILCLRKTNFVPSFNIFTVLLIIRLYTDIDILVFNGIIIIGKIAMLCMFIIILKNKYNSFAVVFCK